LQRKKSIGFNHNPGREFQSPQMFQRLQKKWKVNGLQLGLILCTFAIGGSLTGYTGRRLMNFLPIEQNWLWIIVYILLVTLLWPLSVLLVSVLFGQYRFFTGYLQKLGRRIGLGSKTRNGNVDPLIAHGSPRTRIAIFASGAGSNTERIIQYFRNSSSVLVSLVVCNKPGAGVLGIAKRENVPSLLIEKEKFFRGNAYTDELKEKGIEFIVLAGFLWKIPETLIRAFPGKIINIHPALLPGYGGKGMYGAFVHQAVIKAKETESGITVHYVDEHYDHGDMIFQARCPVLATDTPETLAQRIHELEHEHYPRVIEELVSRKETNFHGATR
jgi:formyltetrahydrofolate-dependent phosphoribosylglycinamide formyltransferase